MLALFQSAQHIYEKRERSGSVPLTNDTNDPDQDQGGPKHANPADPDPQHWFRLLLFLVSHIRLNSHYSKQ